MTATHVTTSKGLDLETEVTVRLLAMIDEMPKRQRQRFRPAARRAAAVLEETCPGLVTMTPRGMLTGLYAATMPGYFTVVLASAAKQVLFTPELRAIPAALEDAGAFLGETATDWGHARGSMPS